MNGGGHGMKVFGLVMALVGVLGMVSWVAAADLDAGKKVFASKCAACHGADGKGNATMAKMLKVTIPDLHQAAGKSDAEIAKLVNEGKKPMPGFAKTLSKEEVQAVVSYVKSLAKGSGK